MMYFRCKWLPIYQKIIKKYLDAFQFIKNVLRDCQEIFYREAEPVNYPTVSQKDKHFKTGLLMLQHIKTLEVLN